MMYSFFKETDRMQLNELRDYIGSLLAVSRFRDYNPNGVQVEGRAGIRRVATAVTASQAVLEAATAWQADAVIVHHGYFWRGEDPCITGIKKQRIAHLLKNDMSLLAYHLPLDAHPELGNNAQLAKRLGFIFKGNFGDQDIASYGALIQPQSLQQLMHKIQHVLQRTPQVIGPDSSQISTIAWCSGGGQGYFEQALALGVNAFLTGEISEQYVHVAQETGVSFIAAGHHATERFGVQALGEHLAAQFGIEHQFFDQDIQV
jgi:dinuclear metal center YbgI/SA1388 family protein